ncbi:LCP family protein [Spiractinospora alimapuensis]|uniref:LCP family protein n=1 Tax=Spiractinospora alimapuensis TaxID=2820884 RepID=UPI001F33758A|nr:LCP family protein [Spiractinospora alimapuensis]QVQ51137.1 LCP family protein [Spiractinospora alimapuensis]
MVDRPNHPDDEGNVSGVFRRGGSGEQPDEFEQLYRGSRSHAEPGGGTRKLPPVDDSPRSRPQGRSRTYEGSGATRRRREARRRRRRTIFFTVLILLLVIPGLLYFWLDSRLERVPALADYEGRPDDQPGTTYMIVGSDSREGLSDEDMAELATGAGEGARLADTVMLLYVPRSGDNPALVSIPRDSLVDIPDHGRERVNAAYSYGGPELLTQTFELNSGVRVDHYVEVGFSGFVDIVDAVGGVELCPDEPMVDPKAGLDMEAGCQTVSGGEALGYVRTRATPRADLDRVERQREFFGALMDRATSPSVMFNPFRALPLAMEGTGNFEVDDNDRLRHLISMGLSMRSGVTTSSVPVVDVPGSGALEWIESDSEVMFQAMRNGEEVPEDVLQD